MEEFKIDQVALQCDLTKRTIRYYEEIGLLPPPQRSKGGIRYYTQEHIDLLKKIKCAKEALGFSLQELQHLLSLDSIIDAQKASYKQSLKRTEQKEKLLEIINTLHEELSLMEQKILKIEQVRNDLKDMKQRAQALVDAINLEEKQEK